MKKRQVTGICKLCGKNTILTYEHVPPKCAFNNLLVKSIGGEVLLREANSDRKPWDISDLRGEIHQQGSGGYYLCEECNTITGSWYAPFFGEFVRGIYAAVEKEDPEEEANRFIIQTAPLRPLPVFKEIMVMFCNINHNCFNDENLRLFLQNKENTEGFDKEKYKVFCYVIRGDVFRMNGIMAELKKTNNNGFVSILLSEISFVPMGFVLYIDMPKGFKPRGCDITEFADCSYDEEARYLLSIPVLENNIVYSGDYRTKEEIEKTIRENEEWRKNNSDLWG